MSIEETVKAVAVRVRIARWNGINARDLFVIDEKELHELSLRLALSLQTARVVGPVHTILGFENVIRITGLPTTDVKHVARWFRRSLTRHARQLADYFGYLMFDIGRYASPIVSKEVLDSRARQLRRQKEYAANHRLVAISKTGEKISINFTNPAESAWRRSSKIYARLKGLDYFCTRHSLDGYFVTLTLPSRFHQNPVSGKRSWDGSTPKEAHAQLQRLWETFRKRYGEAGGKCHGVRVEEPHEDACPHWHALIYIQPERENEFRRRIADTFGDGIAAQVEKIDRSLGSGASYLMKYVNPRYVADSDDHKDLDSFKQSADSASSKDRKAVLYDAHRATWGARSVQFFDVAGSSTIWDEIRRIKIGSAEHARLSEEGLRVFMHATASPPEYGEFLLAIYAMREVNSDRIRVLYGVRESGTKYVKGLMLDSEIFETHQMTWTVERSMK